MITGVLMFGPPGTGNKCLICFIHALTYYAGKTLLAKAVATVSRNAGDSERN